MGVRAMLPRLIRPALLGRETTAPSGVCTEPYL